MKKKARRKVNRVPSVPKVGQKIYVNSSFSLSHGSDDFCGGLATVKKVYKSMSGGDPNCIFVDIEEGDRGYNWTQILKEKQAELKKQFGRRKAHPDPDIDTPWIESGDTVSGVIDGKRYNGETYTGRPIW